MNYLPITDAATTGCLSFSGLFEQPALSLPWEARKFLFSGCLDAPEYILTGHVRAVAVDGGVEALTSATRGREFEPPPPAAPALFDDVPF